MLIIPGPTILTVISYSMSHGRRANVPLVAAVALGDSTALVVSLLGLGALLATSAFWFTVVKWVGGLYLMYLGIKLMRAGDHVHAEMAKPAAPVSRLEALFANTYLVTALNPKGIVFFVAFLPQFISPAADVTRQMWVLAVTFVVLAATLNATLYAVFAGSARKLLSSPRAQKRFNLAGGSLLSAAGIWALMARRPGWPLKTRQLMKKGREAQSFAAFVFQPSAVRVVRGAVVAVRNPIVVAVAVGAVRYAVAIAVVARRAAVAGRCRTVRPRNPPGWPMRPARTRQCLHHHDAFSPWSGYETGESPPASRYCIEGHAGTRSGFSIESHRVKFVTGCGIMLWNFGSKSSSLAGAVERLVCE
jgi:threonine/homoserine/homoserine lactone efflux protein